VTTHAKKKQGNLQDAHCRSHVFNALCIPKLAKLHIWLFRKLAIQIQTGVKMQYLKFFVCVIG
jgi:hypothetical protein